MMHTYKCPYLKRPTVKKGVNVQPDIIEVPQEVLNNPATAFTKDIETCDLCRKSSMHKCTKCEKTCVQLLYYYSF